MVSHSRFILIILESRSWLPKLPMIRSKSDGDDDKSKNSKTTDSQTSAPTHTIGNYNTNDGLLFRSLNLIENEIFYSDKSSEGKHRIINEALAYLKLI